MVAKSTWTAEIVYTLSWNTIALITCIINLIFITYSFYFAPPRNDREESPSANINEQSANSKQDPEHIFHPKQQQPNPGHTTNISNITQTYTMTDTNTNPSDINLDMTPIPIPSQPPPNLDTLPENTTIITVNSHSAGSNISNTESDPTLNCQHPVQLHTENDNENENVSTFTIPNPTSTNNISMNTINEQEIDYGIDDIDAEAAKAAKIRKVQLQLAKANQAQSRQNTESKSPSRNRAASVPVPKKAASPKSKKPVLPSRVRSASTQPRGFAASANRVRANKKKQTQKGKEIKSLMKRISLFVLIMYIISTIMSLMTTVARLYCNGIVASIGFAGLLSFWIAGRLGMFGLFITRLHTSFSETTFRYSKKVFYGIYVLFGMIISTFLSLIIFACLGWFGPMVVSGIIFGLLDIKMSFILVYLFVKRLIAVVRVYTFEIMALHRDSKNMIISNKKTRKKLAEDDEMKKIMNTATKLTNVTLVSLFSNLFVIIILITTGYHQNVSLIAEYLANGAFNLQITINVTCVAMYFHFGDGIYYKLCFGHKLLQKLLRKHVVNGWR